MTRYVFVTGGVVSSIGKGILAAGLGLGGLASPAQLGRSLVRWDRLRRQPAGTPDQEDKQANS